MRVVAIVQARYSSRRLPGKVLRPMAGRPMIEWLIEALRHADGLHEIALATSIDPSDDAVADLARVMGLACWRGPLEDVARRLLGAAQAMSAAAVVRISGDSPLLDPMLVTRAVALFRESGADIVSNVWPRSFPKGQSVEVIAVPALERAIAAMTSPNEREHVTPYFYRHPDEFVLRTFQAASPCPELQLSVDDETDFRRAEALLTNLGSPPWAAGWEAIATLARTAAA